MMNLHTLRVTLLLSLGAACLGGKGSPSEPFPLPDPVDPSTSTVCDGATPIYDGSNFYTGFQRCPDGTIHRVEPGAVDPNWDYTACEGNEDEKSCEDDSDCTAGSFGRCISSNFEPGGESLCACQYSCSVDSDCDPGEVCVAATVQGYDDGPAQCVAASCDGSADCESGECGFSAYDNGCYDVLLVACRTAEDECRTNAECDSGSMTGSCSAPSEEGGWTCRYEECAIGRPLLVDGQARVAAPTRRDDWATQVTLAPLPPEVRAPLAAYWSRVAALEHASIASFARFSLQLLSLGAPPELIADAQRAATDEIAHARLAYGLAQAYLGRPVGPSPLALSDVPINLDRQAILAALIEEGCVGETFGAAEASAAAELAEAPAVRQILRQIAAEEGRHAALAWRTLRWMLLEHPDLSTLAVTSFARAAARSPHPLTPEVELSAHGILTSVARRRLWEATFATVIQPCLQAVMTNAPTHEC